VRPRRAGSRGRPPRDKDAVLVADLNLDMIEEVRSVWQFFRDRRPDAYGPLVAP
jgi:N-carbamoylputrescine amidase